MFPGRIILLMVGLLGAVGCGGSDSATPKTQTVEGKESNPQSMAKGDVLIASFADGKASVSFDGASGTYELILQSQDSTSASGSFSLSNSGSDGIAKALGLEEDLSEDGKLSPLAPQIQLDGVLREEERYLQDTPVAAKSLDVSPSPSINASLAVGATDTFRVLNSLTDTTSYVEVTATVKCINSEVAIFVDNEILSKNPNDFPQTDVDTLCSTYKSQLPSLREWYGSYPDDNGDGVVIALITSQINKLGAAEGGIVTGFFYAGDLYERSASVPSSNFREIVYLVSPDSAGIYGTKISNAFAMSNFLQSVFPHEMQHLISYYQHVLVKKGSAEKDWLNEALSHLTEDLVGQGRENYSRFDLFLAAPQSYPVVTSSSPNIQERGAGYLFMRYLYEQSGKSKDFLKNLIQTDKIGVDNLVAAYPSSSESFNELGEFLQRWAVALAYTDQNITSDPKYIYQARIKNSTTGNWEGVCMLCDAEDGRSTKIEGPKFGTLDTSQKYSVKQSTARFLKLSSLPSSLDISVSDSSKPAAILLKVE